VPDDVEHLTQLVEQRFSHIERLTDERARAIQTALELSAKTNDAHFDMLNGSAQKLSDMQMSYVNRELFDARVLSFQNDMKILMEWKANLTGRGAVINGATAAIVAIVVTLISHLMTEQ
tara:strand:- start:1009 stop:1365 length:357 start_codon:yes stop_codon:yes gene_type:complete